MGTWEEVDADLELNHVRPPKVHRHDQFPYLASDSLEEPALGPRPDGRPDQQGYLQESYQQELGPKRLFPSLVAKELLACEGAGCAADERQLQKRLLRYAAITVRRAPLVSREDHEGQRIYAEQIWPGQGR